MVVRTTGYDLDTAVHQTFAQSFRVLYNVFLIYLVFRAKHFFEAHCFGRDHMHQRAALDAREHRLIKFMFLCKLLAGKDHTAPGSPECFMGGGGSYMGIGNRTWMLSCSYQTGNMSHIYHQICPYLIRDLTESFEVNNAGISAGSCHDQFWLTFQRDLSHLIIVDHAFIIYAIGHNMKISAGHISRASMGQMSAMRQIHTHHCITGLQQSKEYRHVCLSAGMRLHIGIGTSKNLHGAVSGQIFYYVYTLASAIITFSRISFRVFVSQRASHSSHNRFCHPVF